MNGFIALHRGPNTDALRKDRNAFLLLSLIADRARWREEPCKVTGLRQGQAMLGKGDCQAIGLPEKHRGQLRGALKRLEQRGFVTTRGTTRGTIVTLADQSIFSIAVNHSTTPTASEEPSTDQRVASEEPSTDQRATTKNKETLKQGDNEQRNTPPKSPKGEVIEELPHQSIKFQTAWNDWQKHRKEIRKRLTPTTRKKQLAQLGKLPEERAIETIERSIAAGWTGLFEGKSNPSNRPSESSSTTTVAELMAGKQADIINASDLNPNETANHE